MFAHLKRCDGCLEAGCLWVKPLETSQWQNEHRRSGWPVAADVEETIRHAHIVGLENVLPDRDECSLGGPVWPPTLTLLLLSGASAECHSRAGSAGQSPADR